MPSEQSPSSNARPSRAGSAEKDQHPPIVGGVRGLLGLPRCETGLLTTAPLTAPSGGHHYEQPPWPESEENDESFRETVRDEELIGAGGYADPQSDFSGSSPRDGVSSPRAIRENPADKRSAPSATPIEHREQTSLVIPGVSTHRTDFTPLSYTSDKTTVTQSEASQEPSPGKPAPMHTPVSLPRPRETPLETPLFDTEFLSRLEHLAIEGAKARNDLETPRRSVIALSPSLVERMGAPSGEQGGTDVVRRLAQLQRVVSELAATVSRNRDENQAQPRERKTPPPQRTVIIKRSAASSTTPRAFWERSRLGRFYLRTGR